MYKFFFSRSINTHTGNYGVPRQPYEGCTNCFIHEEAHANVRFLSCDGHQLYERGVDLEVEGVRYIEMHRGPGQFWGGAYFRLSHFQSANFAQIYACAGTPTLFLAGQLAGYNLTSPGPTAPGNIERGNNGT